MEETPSTVAIPIMFYDLLGYQHACLSRLFVTVLESSAVALAVRLACMGDAGAGWGFVREKNQAGEVGRRDFSGLDSRPK